MTDSVHIVCPHCQATNRLPAARLAGGANCGRCKQALFQGHPVELNGATFDKQISRNDVPVVVDFWAPWCGPCKMMAPAFEQAARELEPHVRLAKLNTENEPGIASRFAIRSIPTTAIFQAGRELVRQAGAMDAATLTRWIRSQL